jgi:membrane-bound lytic murein transglycosylase B
LKAFILLITIFFISLSAKDYTKDEKAIKFMDMMSKEYNFKKTHLEKLLSDVEVQKFPLKFYSSTKKSQEKEDKPKFGTWDKYVKHKVTAKRVDSGISFINKHQKIFNKVEKTYGIPVEYIAAIIGIESAYGKYMGDFPVFDTLATLAFEKNRRNKFFKNELKEFIKLSYRHKVDPKSINGSYAGAIGLGQFMPSSFKAYGIDYNKDGKISLLHPEDAIASVANYLKKSGWKKNEPVATRVSYKGTRFNRFKTGFKTKYKRKELTGIKPKHGKWHYNKDVRLIKLDKKSYDELWYGANNFYVITRYNRSSYYAMSVHQLAQKISKELKIRDKYVLNSSKSKKDSI